jgi:hypothetical protein
VVEPSALLEAINVHGPRLGERVLLIGRTCHTGSDDAYFAVPGAWRRYGVSAAFTRPLVTGDVVRDYSIFARTETLFPYDDDLTASLDEGPVARLLWRNRAGLSERREPGGTHAEIGLTWYEFSRWHPERFSIPLGIGMAFVATHNHFVLDRGGKVFKQSAPVIKLPAEATEDDHLALLGILNSSTACFWLKQNSHGKGNGGGNEGFRGDDWEESLRVHWDHVAGLPASSDLPLTRGRLMDSLAQDLAAVSPGAVAEAGVPTAAALAAAHEEYTSLRGRMIAEQEELDWEVYRLYGLIDDDLTSHGEVPEVALGERSFEIVLARKAAAGDEETAWFARHGSTPITQIPEHWPADYRDLVQRRLDRIESDRSIRLLETPEHKRRWATEPWEKQVDRALRSWLLDRLEQRHYWFDQNGRPTPTSIGRLADVVTRDADLVSVLELWSGSATSRLPPH